MYFFPLENRNVPLFLGFETQKSGQFRLIWDGWQVCFLLPTTFSTVTLTANHIDSAVIV